MEPNLLGGPERIEKQESGYTLGAGIVSHKLDLVLGT